MEDTFEIADSIQIECAVGGELRVGGKLVIGEKGVVNANVETVDAIIMGHYDGNMTATGNVEIAATGRVSGNIKTDSLVISKGGFFNGNVAKINEESAASPRPVYLVEDKRAGQSVSR
jgi:cytoskeletal protein CcmA (bactofilin family)